MASLTGNTVATTYLSLIKTNDNAVIDGTHRALTDGDGNAIGMQVKTSGAPRFNSGILFGSDTAAANTLDDYEEGTFTPGFTINGSATGITFSSRSGTYTKIGDFVFFTIEAFLSSKGASSGAVAITGLPFTNGASAIVPSILMSGFNAALSTMFIAQIASSAQSVGIYKKTSTSITAIANTDIEDSTAIIITGTYKI